MSSVAQLAALFQPKQIGDRFKGRLRWTPFGRPQPVWAAKAGSSVRLDLDKAHEDRAILLVVVVVILKRTC